MRGRLALGACLLAAFAAVRCAMLFAAFWSGQPDTRAHHVQSAALLFAILAGAAVWLRTRREPVPSPVPLGRHRSPVTLCLAFVAAAFVLYAPALTIGRLSDDFVLLDRASDWQLGAVSSALFRPLVLWMWAVVMSAGAGDTVLHLINIVLHGVVAWLTTRVASGWADHGWTAVVAGALVLTMPLAVEPVAWISGAFDVTAAALVLAMVLVARRYERDPSVVMRIAFGVLAIAAILAKETAVVAGLIVLIDRWIRRAGASSRLTGDALMLTAAGAVYAFIRLQWSEPAAEPISRYVVQRGIFQTFGNLAQPAPAVTQGTDAAAIAVSALLALLVLAVWTSRRSIGRPIAGAAVWILLSVAPVFTWLVIGSNLDQSRYLYLATPAWAAALAAAASSLSFARWRLVAGALLVVIAGLNGTAARAQLHSWTRAASARDRAIGVVVSNADARACRTIRVDDLPDNVNGAYVFRNGAQLAFAARGVRLADDADPACRFVWTSDAIIRR